MQKLSALLVMLVLLHSVSALPCVSFRDCPKPECIGAVRQCTDNMCFLSSCIVPKESELGPREGIASFEDSVEPFERGINLSIKTKNPAGVKNSIVGALGLQKILFVLLKVIGILFTCLVAAMFLFFLKGRGLVKILAILAVSALFVVSGVLLLSGTSFMKRLIPSERSWNTIEFDDFAESGYDKTELGKNQMNFISSRLLSASEYIWHKHGNEASVLMLEIDDARYLRSINLGHLGRGDVKKMDGEYMMVRSSPQVTSYVFDEDRFVFVVTARDKEIKSYAESILKRYPGPPTKSRLFLNDLVPPRIFGIEPMLGSVTNDNSIAFAIEDNESGIDENSLIVKGISGFRDVLLDCARNHNQYYCSFMADDMIQGRNGFEISVRDREGNLQTQSRTFLFDREGIEFRMIEPSQNKYTSSNLIHFELFDSVSGIDPDSLIIEGTTLDLSQCNMSLKRIMCRFNDPSMVQGKNSLIIIMEDHAHNRNRIERSFFYDITAPSMVVKDYYLEAYDNMGIRSIRVNDQPFDLESCSKDENTYFCSSQLKIHTVYAEDLAGNIREI